MSPSLYAISAGSDTDSLEPAFSSDAVEVAQRSPAAGAFGLPVTARITRPAPEESLWVNLIGRG